MMGCHVNPQSRMRVSNVQGAVCSSARWSLVWAPRPFPIGVHYTRCALFITVSGTLL